MASVIRFSWLLPIVAVLLWNSEALAQTVNAPSTASTALTPIVLGPRSTLPFSFTSKAPSMRSTAEFEALLDNPDQWSELRLSVGAILYPDWGFRSMSDTELNQWMSKMRALNLTLELEVGVIKPWSSSGEKSFQKDSVVWDRIIKAGGVISAVAMDDPLSAAVSQVKPPMSVENGVREIAAFVALVHQHYPNIKVGLINPYPFFSPEDTISAVNNLQGKLSHMGARGLDFYRMDPNWIAFVLGNHPGSWDGMKQIQQYCDSIKLPFSLIYWPAGYPRDVKLNGDVHDDKLWYKGLMQEGAGYAGTGMKPNQIVIESWVGAPSLTVPESNSLTLTGSALDFLHKYGLSATQ